MPNSSFDSPSDSDEDRNLADQTGLKESDLSKVLIVGKSQINRVVVAKIVERSGLKCESAIPEETAQKLVSSRPCLVILDGGADNRDCDGLMAALVDLRRVSAKDVPCVILLTNRAGTPEGVQIGSPVDAVVAKPITPESLQPVIDRLLERVRR